MPDQDDFRGLMSLQASGPAAFVGGSLDWPIKRVFGGQVIAQALAAASSTVAPPARVHSLHASFLRGGLAAEPIRYDVEHSRDGRSFASRRVVASQAAGVLLTGEVSFQMPEDHEVDLQNVSLPAGVEPPDGLVNQSRVPVLERRPLPSPPGRARAWIRVHGSPLPADPVLAACALAFASDDLPTNTVRGGHPAMVAGRYEDRHTLFMNASLDHAIWFHRPTVLGEWLLFDLRSPGLTGGRGLALGEVYQADGTHVATVAQEVLLRGRRPRP